MAKIIDDGRDDELSDGDGVDRVDGSGGKDTLSDGGGDGAVRAEDVFGDGSGDDTIGGTPGDDRLNGRAGDDMIFAGDGDDRISGGAGDDFVEITDLGRDRVDLGSGDDLLFVLPDYEPSGQASLDGGKGHDVLRYTSLGSISFDGSVLAIDGTILAETVNFEAVDMLGRRIVGLAGDDTIGGTERSDRLLGLDGDDQLSAGEGRDTLRGGEGDDDISLILDGRRDLIDGGAGFDMFRHGAVDEAVVMNGRVDQDFTVAYGGRAAVVGMGFEALTAQGGLGDDRLLGGAAADVVDRAGLGRDVVRTFGGDDQASVSIDDRRDRIDLGAGFDTAVLRQDVGAPSLSEDVVMSHDDGVLTVTADGREAIRIVDAERFVVASGTGDDRLLGGDADDRLSAGAGRNLLKGFEGDDALAIRLDGARDRALGGAGDDALTVSAGSSDDLDGGLVTEVTGEGAFRVTLRDRVLLEAKSVESVDLTGNEGADLLIGQDGADVLRGAQFLGLQHGEDTLIGGAGDDTLIGGFDTALIDGGEGSDTADLSALSSSQGFELALDSGKTVQPNASGVELARLAGVENVIAGDGDDRITGDAGGNVIDGGEGADTLDGGDGTDTVSFASLSAEMGVEVSLSDGVAVERNQVDIGPEFNNVVLNFENVIGSDGYDAITGDAGANRIAGGAGFDVLAGGGGADTFVFGREPLGILDPVDLADRVSDFSSADGDRLDVRALAADAANATPGALAFVGRGAFSGAGGEVRYEMRDGMTVVLIDLDGDRRSDQPIVLEGHVDLSETDFILG